MYRYCGYNVETKEQSFGTSGTRYTIYRVRSDGKQIKRGYKEWAYRYDPSRAEERDGRLVACGAIVENSFVPGAELLEYEDGIGWVPVSFGPLAGYEIE